jgi:hypothetical protein
MTSPQPKPRRARKVVRLNRLRDYTGNGPTMDDELVRLGLLHPYSMSPGGRSKVIDEDEIVALQQAAKEAGSLEALVAKARAEQAKEKDKVA